MRGVKVLRSTGVRATKANGKRKQGELKMLKTVTLLFQKCGVAYWR